MTRPPEAFRLLLALCALAIVSVDVATAETADRQKPINFTADDGVVNYEKRTGVLKGNVVITQGTMTIRADRITFKQNGDNSISATAHGNPIAFRQKRDGSDEYFEGFAQRAEYDGEKETLELFDRALLKRGTDEIRSNYISYNTRSEQFRAEGRPDAAGVPANAGPGARVRGVFQPKSEEKAGGDGKDKDAKAAAPAKPAPKAGPLPLKRSGEIAPKAAK
jgi:lipopolysaccharide export system protein LptA